jgi:hypothetical protein
VSQSAPGWYQDHDDPRLARWWDGERWTEHTLVLDEQDWSTEPAPPQTGTRFPTPSTGEVPVVETVPEAGFEEDIYAPIRDPWGEDEVPDEVATTAWSSPDEVWGAGGTAAIATNPAWDNSGTDTSWTEDGRRGPGGVAGWPSWAKVAVPLGVLALVLLLASVTGAFGGNDDNGTTTTSSTTSTVVSLGDAAQTALRAAGDGPFTLSTFTTLIPLTCDSAASNTPTNVTDRIVLLNYDADTVDKLINGLTAGTNEYCPDDMAKSPGFLAQVQTAVAGGTTTSTSTAITLPTDSTTTTKKPTATTKKPTTTTKAPTTTTPPTTPPTEPPTTPPTDPTTSTTAEATTGG